MLSIVYYWLQNAIRFLWENIRSWCAICVCLQRESELGVTQELALQSTDLAQVWYFWCIICDLSRNISVVPNPQFPFNTEFFTTSTFRDPLDSSSLHPTCRHFTCPFMDTITFLTVVSDSKTSVTSTTLALIWPSHIDLSLVPPFPSTTTANSMSSWYGDRHAFSSHGYYCVVRRHEFISLPFQLISSGTSPEYVLVDQSCFFNFFSTIPFLFHHSRNSSFFAPFPFFFLKNVVRCHTIQRWGDQLKMDRFCMSLLERPEFVDSQECTNR